MSTFQEQMIPIIPEADVAIILNSVEIPEETLKWHDISHDVVAKLGEVYDETNLHYNEELDDKKIKIDRAKESSNDLVTANQPVLTAQSGQLGQPGQPMQPGESLHEAFSRIQNSTVIPGVTLKSAMSIKSERTPAVQSDKDKFFGKNSEIKVHGADGIKSENFDAIDKEKKVTRAKIDFSKSIETKQKKPHGTVKEQKTLNLFEQNCTDKKPAKEEEDMSLRQLLLLVLEELKKNQNQPLTINNYYGSQR